MWRIENNGYVFCSSSGGHYVDFSYGSFSPYTGIPGVYLVFDSGNVPDHDNNFKNSYGIALRTPTTATPMRIMWIRVVSLAVGISRIPTEITAIIHLSGIPIISTKARL